MTITVGWQRHSRLLLGGALFGTVGSFSTQRMIVPYLGFLADSSKEVFHLPPEKKRHPRNMITRRALTPGTIKTGRVLRSQSHKEAILYHGRVKHIFTPFLYLNHATTIHSNRHVKWLYKLANI